MADIRTLADLIRHHARERPDQAAMVLDDRTLTYADMHSESNRVARAMLDAGVEPQDRVAFLGKNELEYFTFLFGAAKVNAVTVAVNWRLAPPEMAYILNHSRARIVLVGQEFVGHLDKMDLEHDPAVVVLGEGGGEGRPSYEEWIAGCDDVDPEVEVGPDDTCYQLYTSGTTGFPKGVELTGSNFFDMLPGAAAEWGFDTDSVNLVAMPLFHIAGSGWGVVGLFVGGTNIVMRDIDPSEMLRVIGDRGVTNAMIVPAVLQFMLAVPEIDRTDFSALRSVVYGASPITEPVLVGAMEKMGADFCGVYGLTETTGAVTILRPDEHDPGGPRARLLRSVGRPMPRVEVRIVDPAEMVDLPDGEVGEVWVRTPQNLKAYFADRGATDDAFPEGRDDEGLGWFRTGDAGYLEDGYLFIHDRVKDMIVSGGENVYPAEVENALMAHPDVADAAVIGVPHDKWGETVKAIVVPAGDAAPAEADLVAWCKERLAGFKCPTSVDTVEAIPRNPSGKILKTELRAPYWEGRDRMVN